MTSISIDHLAAMQAAHDEMTAEIRRLTKAADALKRHIQHEMGDHDVALIGGQPAYTWKRTGRFNATQFTTENAELAAKYTVVRPALDEGGIAKDHPALFEKYRARVFLRKD